ncbi:MAG: phosphoadenosine phosphosulfate reductase family protein [Methanoregulaceae archaeon]|nr:phosphoadenosine phosphosulfate reductase family protein [Methanoregulaceae archaeon]MCU0628269.1 phosphoadenosine phosphosulfate reductase family protein [Methanoregulaceae archaeon]
MRPSFLGKMLLHWCDTCHVPVLSDSCACGAGARKVPVTPPGDIRPAFPADVSLINSIYTAHFGAPLIPPGHIALLNKVPDNDRMEEIMMGGAVVGAIRYIPGEKRWEPLPRPEAALYLHPSLRFVVVDPGAVASIRDEGASVLAPGLVTIHPSVRAGDEVFILDPSGDYAGVGRARADAAEAVGMTRGSVVRTRKNVRSSCIPAPSTWDDAVLANARVLEEAEAEAIRFIRNVSSNYTRQATVSYSGGKDSLATLLLVMKAIGRVPLLFADTGLEFPETYQNVEDVAALYELEVVRSDGGSRFWEAFARNGPPAVNRRWCCSACKLLPLYDAILGRWGECLSFIGQRRYESFRRKESSRVFKNGIVKNQVSAAPIQNWTALHVWLYLFRENAPFNPLYAERLDRIGCYMCPSSDVAILEVIREKYPELWIGWELHLSEWCEEHGLPSRWMDEMSWRLQGKEADETYSDC